MESKKDKDGSYWEYRILKSYNSDTDESSYSIEECLMDKDGVLQCHTIENTPKFETIKELKTEMNQMIDSVDKQVLGEIPSCINRD
jgi:hypothetical protein